MRAMRSCLYVLGASALLMSAAPALAWTGLNGNFPIWQSLPVRYEINASSAQELGANSAQSVVEESYSSWASPDCSGFRAQNQGTTQGGWSAGDQVNTHIWIYNANQRPSELSGRETIGVTLSYFQGNRLIDGDILYNGIDHRWTTNPTQGGQVDAVSIITHEVGHQLGLGHSQRTAATMYFAYTGGTGARSLDSDDIQGVCSLYPGSGATGCSTDNDCPQGERCGGGTCIPDTQGEGGVGESCAVGPCAGDLVCVQGNGGEPFCTSFCSGGDCPSGWACIGVNSNQGALNLCLPSAEGGGDASFGERCDNGPDCSSGLCIQSGQSSFCSEVCIDDDGCPSGASCYALSGGGGACVPGGGVSSGAFGDACENGQQCDSELCISDGTRAYCSAECSGDGDCPAGAACYALEDGSGACVIEEGDEPPPPDEPRLGFNEDCEETADCESELCVDDGSRTFCSAYCSEDEPCPQGASCVELTTGGGACLPSSAPEPPPPSPSCGPSAPCPEGQSCYDGQCSDTIQPPPPVGGEELPYDPRSPVAGQDSESGQAINSDDIGCAAQSGGLGLHGLLLLALALMNSRRRRGVNS